MPDVDALCDAYHAMHGDPSPDYGPSTAQELADVVEHAYETDERKLSAAKIGMGVSV